MTRTCADCDEEFEVEVRVGRTPKGGVRRWVASAKYCKPCRSLRQAGGARRRFCIAGHDTELTGRRDNGNCIVCEARGGPIGQPCKRFCVSGHDTEALGRRANGTCVACARIHEVRYRQNRVIKSVATTGMVPSQRLIRYAHTKEAATAAWFAYRNCSLRSADTRVHRLWNTTHISIDCADRWCIALGTHLSILYPEIYSDAADSVEGFAG